MKISISKYYYLYVPEIFFKKYPLHTGGGLYKRWDQKFYFSKTMIFVSIMMVGHK